MFVDKCIKNTILAIMSKLSWSKKLYTEESYNFVTTNIDIMNKNKYMI